MDNKTLDMTTDIEIVNINELPQQLGSDFEMVGRNTTSGDAVRVSPDRIVEKLLDGCYIPSNVGQSIVASSGALTIGKPVHGAVYIVTPGVGKITVAETVNGFRYSILFVAASASVTVTTVKQKPVLFLLPVGVERLVYTEGGKYLMEVMQIGGDIYAKVMTVK